MLAGITNLRRLDQVEHFWDTVDTIGEGFGFSLFGARHLVTLALYIGFAALSCKLYKAADEKKRAQLRGLFAVLLLADEAFKQIGRSAGISTGTICRCTCVRSTFSLSRCTHGSRAGCSTIFSILSVSPRRRRHCCSRRGRRFRRRTSCSGIRRACTFCLRPIPSCCFRAVISDRASGTWASASCCCWRWRCRFIASTCCSIRISCF